MFIGRTCGTYSTSSNRHHLRNSSMHLNMNPHRLEYRKPNRHAHGEVTVCSIPIEILFHTPCNNNGVIERVWSVRTYRPPQVKRFKQNGWWTANMKPTQHKTQYLLKIEQPLGKFISHCQMINQSTRSQLQQQYHMKKNRSNTGTGLGWDLNLKNLISQFWDNYT